MSPWKPHSPWQRVSRAIAIVAWAGISFAGILLHAQTEAVPDPSAPPAAPPAQTAPVVPATQAPTTPTQSAVTQPPDSAVSTYSNSAVSAAGPVPVAGPGSGYNTGPDLGDRLNSSSTANRLPFRVTAALGEVYDNNIFATRHKVDDFITRIAVTGEVQSGKLTKEGQAYVVNEDGNYVDLIYSPTLHLYATHSHENGVDQNVDLLYAHRFSKLTLSVEQIYSKTQQTDASIGGLYVTDLFRTTLKANYVWSDKLDLVSQFNQEFLSYDEPAFSDSREWSDNLYALYHVDDRLSVGLGPRFGFLLLDDAPDEFYQQVVARAIYAPSEKLFFQGAAGGEVREYKSEQSDDINPIFEFTGRYLPFPSTNIALDAARRFRPSYNFAGQNYIATNVDLNVTQRFFQYYYAGMVLGYENDDYHATGGDIVGPNRTDNYYYVQPNVSWKPNGWLAVAAFDRYEEDNSNFMTFSYDTNQVGISVSATY